MFSSGGLGKSMRLTVCSGLWALGRKSLRSNRRIIGSTAPPHLQSSVPGHHSTSLNTFGIAKSERRGGRSVLFPSARGPISTRKGTNGG